VGLVLDFVVVSWRGHALDVRMVAPCSEDDQCGIVMRDGDGFADACRVKRSIR